MRASSTSEHSAAETTVITLPKPHPTQRAILEKSARFNVVCCGRRIGKTTMAFSRIAPLALQYPCAWATPSYRELSQVWKAATSMLAPLITSANKTEKQIVFRTGGLLDFYSLDRENTSRGKKYRAFVVDEAALVRGLLQIFNAVIRPTLADYAPDSECWFLSTPQGRNDFHTLYTYGDDPTMADWRNFHAPTSASPYIDPAEIAAMRAGLPERVYLQEIEAHFLDDSNAVFRRLREASTAELQDEAQPGHSYVIGVDWARSHDYTVIVVLDTSTSSVVYLDRFTEIDYSMQVSRLKAAYSRFKPDVIMAESNSIGGPLTEQLAREGLPVRPINTSNATKQTWVDALALAFEEGQIAIPDDPILRDELMSFEATRLPSGLTRYAAPEGKHDDMVMALLLAWQAKLDDMPLLLW
jgi:hypothetical protein